MSLVLDANEAKKADNISSAIREAGKYIGVITRAEKLVSKNNVEGLGLSIRTDDGQTANYLDVYTVKPDGEKLRGLQIVQAILACTQTREAQEGQITFDRWDKEQGQMVKANAPGYPVLMGKRIGLLLQKELGTNNGKDTERLNIFGVFQADTELTASEILERKTTPEKLERMVLSLMANPVRDTRKSVSKPASSTQSPASSFDDLEDDIPF